MEVITVSTNNYEKLMEELQHEREKNAALHAVIKRLKAQLAEQAHRIIEMQKGVAA